VPVTKKFHLIPLDKIIVSPDRNRKKMGSIDELADSISRYGLLNPVTITKTGQLIAGERRFRAHQKLRLESIPAQFYEELDPFEVKAVEIEENARRLDLDWREEAMAVLDYHELRRSRDPEWTVEMTGDALGMERNATSRRVAVAQELRTNPKKFESFDGLYSAYNFIRREHQRLVDEEANTFLSDPDGYLDEVLSEDIEVSELPKKVLQPMRPALGDIHNVTFQEWLEKDWKDEKFNVVHCDFPYGIYHHKSDQGGMEKREGESYEDTPEIFWGLCDVLAKRIDTLLDVKAHIIFWYPTHFYTEIKDYFTAAGLVVDPVPLVWVKSDNTGILPDSNRGPRRIYETAFLMSKNDRLIVRAVSNAIAFPANRQKAKHPSEKPFEVVSHFLQMVVDEHTRFLDPTCGSGTAIAAAENLDAKLVTGCEPNSDHAYNARSWLNKIRVAKLDL